MSKLLRSFLLFIFLTSKGFNLLSQEINNSILKVPQILLVGDSYTSVNCLKCEMDSLFIKGGDSIKIITLCKDGTSIVEHLKDSKEELQMLSKNFYFDYIIFQDFQSIFDPTGEFVFLEALKTYHQIFPKAQLYLSFFSSHILRYPYYACQKNDLTKVSDCIIYKSNYDLQTKINKIKQVLESEKYIRFLNYLSITEKLKEDLATNVFSSDQYGHPTKRFQTIKAFLILKEILPSKMIKTGSYSYIEKEIQNEKILSTLLNYKNQ